MRITFTLVVGLAAATVACREKKSETSAMKADSPAAAAAALPAGESYLDVDGGKIWYKVSGASTGTPVILLHGGPGYASFYMKPMEALGDEHPVVRYDQLGGGKADHVTDTALFNIAHFVKELDSLRAKLGYDKFHVVGHSWGTILGFEYYRAHPEHVLSLTLMSPALDIPTWEKNARRMLKTLPESSQKVIAKAEKEQRYDSKEYEAANNEFCARYVWLRPDTVELDSTFATAGMPVYLYMQGPSEYTIVGTLKKYNSTSALKDVKVPTLFTVGDHDEADPPTVKRFAAMTPGAKYVVIPNAAHLVEWDNPEATVKAVREFLREVDAKGGT